MPKSKRRLVILAFVALVVLPTFQGHATSVLQMNLEQLCLGSAQIFRGTVLTITETTVQAGGGPVPAVTYTVQVEEAFQGEFQTVKGVQVAEFTTIGTKKQHLTGQMPIEGLPTLEIGGDYLLMVAPAGPVGLTATMGLGQGCFTIGGRPGEETAVNMVENHGLFDGMTLPAGLAATPGPVSYAALADLINSIVGAE